MKRGKGLNIWFMVTLLFAMVGCAVSDVDRKVDFRRYKTFAWEKSVDKTENPIYNSDLINKNIKTTIEVEFAKRGIAFDPKDPDLVVSYKSYTEKKEAVSAGTAYGPYPFFPRMFYSYHYGWMFPYGVYNNPDRYTFTEGTLIVDIADGKTKEMIWRGTVSGNVDNVKKLQKQIEKGIRAIMKKYPVPESDNLLLPDQNTVS
jgi:hypothetical protein